MDESKGKRNAAYRSLFWPIVLIGIGVVWLLGNMGILQAENLVVMARLWPLILIVIGLDLLFGRSSPILGAVIGLGTVALLVGLMLVGPSLGWGSNLEVVTLQSSEPIGDAKSAQVTLDITTGALNLNALSDSNQLIDFDITSLGKVDYTVSGETQKTITFNQVDQSFEGFAALLLGIFENDSETYSWNVGLSPDVPLDLDVSNATGAIDLDLRGLQLNNLQVDMATGSVELILPNTENSYDATIKSATGGGTITIEDGAAANLDISVATGGYTIDIPDGAAVRVQAEIATGDIDVSGTFHVVQLDDDRIVGAEGIWETENFASAERQITIVYEGATGGLTIR